MFEIDSREIRVGNTFLSHSRQKFVKLTVIDIRTIVEGNCQNSYYPDVPVFEPIEVTRDLLLNSLDFKLCAIRDGVEVFCFDDFWVTLDEYPNFGVIESGETLRCWETLYLHQLENLFLDLGREIKVIKKCKCKKATFTRDVDEDFEPLCGECGRRI